MCRICWVVGAGRLAGGLEGWRAKWRRRACAKPGNAHAPAPLLRAPHLAPHNPMKKARDPARSTRECTVFRASTLLCAPLSRESLGLLGDGTLRRPLTGGTTASSPGFDSHSHFSSRPPFVAGCPNFFLPPTLDYLYAFSFSNSLPKLISCLSRP